MASHDILSKIGEKIRAKRLDKKLTLQQVAESTNLTKGLLSRIENSRTMPSLPVFVKLLGAMDISIRDFFFDLSDHEQRTYWLFRKNEYKSSQGNGAIDFDYRHILAKVVPVSSVT